MRIKNLLLTVSLAIPLLIHSGCGDDGGGSLESNVVGLFLGDSTLSVGESTVVTVEFSYDAGELFDDDREVSLVLQLPAGLFFVEGSSEIDIEPGDDDSVGGLVTLCASGESFIVFNLDENDLDNAENPGGNADARLTLTAAAVAPGVGTLEARADEQAIFACGADFIGEASAAVEVTG